MDKGIKNISSEKKAEKDLIRNTRLRILKNRKRTEFLIKELDQFKEVRSLLENADGSNDDAKAENVLDGKEAVPNDIQAILKPDLAFLIFTEDSLKLADFIPADFNFYGHALNNITESAFRNLLKNRIFELRDTLANDCQDLSLYVLHLLSVTADIDLLEASFDFLCQYPCSLTAVDLLPIFVNFGAESVQLCGATISAPDRLRAGGARRNDFPFRNIQLVLKYLIFCTEKELLLCDSTLKPFVLALTTLTTDPRIRYSELLPLFTGLLTSVINVCETALGPKVVASWLHLPNWHLSTQLDISRITVRPTALNAQHALIGLIINRILRARLKLQIPLKIEDFKLILARCKKQAKAIALSDLLVIFELLISALPHITATQADTQSVSSSLASLEAHFANAIDFTELAYFRSSAAKLRSSFVIRGSSQFAPNLP